MTRVAVALSFIGSVVWGGVAGQVFGTGFLGIAMSLIGATVITVACVVWLSRVTP